MNFTALYWRFHQNFLMGDRISEYRDLLLAAKEHKYMFLTISELAAIAYGSVLPPGLAFVLRNDVDTDISTARAMFETEKALGIRSTYYFRLSTLDAALMHDMQNHGTEVGYHFEELATVVKRLGLRNSAEAELNLEAIRAEFRRNIKAYKMAAGAFPKTVASHGDFSNRVVGMTNSAIIDQCIRHEFGIVAEVYDDWLNKPVTRRLSDQRAPTWWSPMPLREALAAKPECLYVLVHPRQWRANFIENVKVEATRIAEGARFFAARMVRGRRQPACYGVREPR